MQPAMQPVDGSILQVLGGLSGEPLTVHLTSQEAKKIESVRDLKRCLTRNVTRPLGRSFQKDKAKVVSDVFGNISLVFGSNVLATC